jgi:hypothetical protein
MEYIVFYRTLDTNHAKWGPQWTHRYDVVEINVKVATIEDIQAIAEQLSQENNGKRVEVMSMIPLDH